MVDPTYHLSEAEKAVLFVSLAHLILGQVPKFEEPSFPPGEVAEFFASCFDDKDGFPVQERLALLLDLFNGYATLAAQPVLVMSDEGPNLWQGILDLSGGRPPRVVRITPTAPYIQFED